MNKKTNKSDKITKINKIKSTKELSMITRVEIIEKQPIELDIRHNTDAKDEEIGINTDIKRVVMDDRLSVDEQMLVLLATRLATMAILTTFGIDTHVDPMDPNSNKIIGALRKMGTHIQDILLISKGEL